MLTAAPEDVLKGVLTLLVLLWNATEGAVFENEYPATFIKLYPLAIWRILLVLAVIAAIQWCPTLGYMLAFAIFFYVMDMEVTMDKWR